MDGKLGREGRNGKAGFQYLRASATRKASILSSRTPRELRIDAGWGSQPKPKLTYLWTTENR